MGLKLINTTSKKPHFTLKKGKYDICGRTESYPFTH
jgi:hypothetical protein